MKARLFTTLFAVVAVSASLSEYAVAETYTCPTAEEVRCVPATSTIGPWQANGGQMTGNTFAPNNQCANVISMGPDTQRLLCCYQKCGVFLRDVRAKSCTKVSESQFDCR